MKGGWPLAVFPLLKLALHLAFIRGYGYFRDEFYYLACADHPALGYVDHPPLSILVLRAWRALFGDSVVSIRVLPAVAGALTVLLVGLIARRMGGGRLAQSVAMAAAVATPVYLELHHFYSMNAFDVLIWALAAYLLARLCRNDRPGTWILLGLVLGCGLQNKISMLWLGFGLGAGLLLSSRRRDLLTPGPWIAGALAGLVFLPHLAWQVVHGWPTLEFIRNATQNKMVEVSPLDFLSGQFFVTSPLLAPLWILGLLFLLFAPRGAPFRLLGWTYVAVFSVLMLSGSSRSGYLGPAYTWLLAAGAVAVGGRLERSHASRIIGASLVAAILLVGAVFAPFALPVLSVERYVSYAAFLGIEPVTEERKELSELPQFYADMHGWEAKVATIAAVYGRLEPAEQQVACVFTSNYGVAGAVTLLGRARGLPTAVSGHNNYWMWGPQGCSGEVMIVAGGNEERLRELFEEVELGAVVDCGLCMPYENHQPLWICRGLKMPLADLWPGLKHYD